MKRLTRALVLPLCLVFIGAQGACGEDDAGAADARDTVGAEILFPDVGTSPGTDTAGASDTAVVDSTTGADTATAATDTAVVDTATAATDTAVADTATAATDTAVVDTAPIEDTVVVDTATAATDSAVVDTAPIEDTTVVDTKVGDDADGADGGEPACQIGGCETDMAPAGDTCANAYVIGRPNALTGFGHAGSTVGAGNDSDFPQAACGDSGPDRFYRIYLKVGEQLWVNANPSPASFDVTFALYRGAACETPITCVDNDVDQTTPDTMPYQAVVEGWHTLVVDGRGSQGDYTVVVTLDCLEDDCCCR